MDKLTKEQRSKNMQAVRSSGSKIETAFAKRLYANGHRYRKNDKSVFGKPDIMMKRFKLAIFIDSEFWHGKNWAIRKLDLKSNIEFWHQKIEGNIKRDKLVNKTLRKEGWIVLRFWGDAITKDLENCINKVENKINEIKKQNSI